jgi:hypothetical protein
VGCCVDFLQEGGYDFESIWHLVCGGRDLNPHGLASTRFQGVSVCQFRHPRTEKGKLLMTNMLSYAPTAGPLEAPPTWRKQ